MGSLNLAMNLSDIGHCIIASLDIDRWEAIRR